MKTSELINYFWQAINAADEMPLSEAEEQLYASLHLAVMAYEDEIRLGHPALERRCMICNKLISQCYC